MTTAQLIVSAAREVDGEPPVTETAVAIDAQRANDGKSTRTHIRGSTLLLVGRAVSMVINLATQVLLARYLAKDDFGAFTYALAAIALGTSVVSLGLDKSSRRFVPIFHEQGDYRRLLGTIVFAVGTMVGMGLLLVTLLFALRGVLAQHVTDQLTLTLTLVLMVLAPVEALNRLCVGLVATFAGARAIFFRQHIIGPTLKLLVVSLLVVTESNVFLLAAGYVATGFVGVAFYFSYLVHVLRKQGLWRQLLREPAIVPGREVLNYSLPLLSSDVATVARAFLAVYFLGLFHGTAMVAVFRVVLPIAGLNKVVFETFQFLFMPLASRLYARGDRSGIDHLYWRTALWIAVLTYPVFLITFAAAEPLTALIVGPRYQGAGNVLAWLSLGFFFNVALGFNTLALKVFGDVRQIVRNDVLATAVTLGLFYWLVPVYGAVGAAIANCLALVFHNVVNQISLVRTSGINFFPSSYLRLYAAMGIGALALAALHSAWSPPLYLSVAVAGAVSVAIVVAARQLLEVGEMFPEVARLPLVRRYLCVEPTP